MNQQFVEYVLRDRATRETVKMRIEFVAGGQVAKSLPLDGMRQAERGDMWGFDVIHFRRGDLPDADWPDAPTQPEVPPKTIDPFLGG